MWQAAVQQFLQHAMICCRSSTRHVCCISRGDYRQSSCNLGSPREASGHCYTPAAHEPLYVTCPRSAWCMLEPRSGVQVLSTQSSSRASLSSTHHREGQSQQHLRKTQSMQISQTAARSSPQLHRKVLKKLQLAGSCLTLTQTRVSRLQMSLAMYSRQQQLRI